MHKIVLSNITRGDNLETKVVTISILVSNQLYLSYVVHKKGQHKLWMEEQKIRCLCCTLLKQVQQNCVTRPVFQPRFLTF